MSDLMSQVLPHVGAALVIACIALAVSGTLNISQRTGIVVFAGAIVLSLIPLPEYTISHYARVLTGDVSITTLIWLSYGAINTLSANKQVINKQVRAPVEIVMSAIIVITALVLYPTALGFSMVDLYAEGYQPLILAPLIFLLFTFSLWLGQWLPVIILAGCLLAYQLNWLESDNLWDYLIDPVITLYALAVVYMERGRLHKLKPVESQLETLLGLSLLIFLGSVLAGPAVSLL